MRPTTSFDHWGPAGVEAAVPEVDAAQANLESV